MPSTGRPVESNGRRNNGQLLSLSERATKKGAKPKSAAEPKAARLAIVDDLASAYASPKVPFPKFSRTKLEKEGSKKTSRTNVAEPTCERNTPKLRPTEEVYAVTYNHSRVWLGDVDRHTRKG